jgi:hypothetical protein
MSGDRSFPPVLVVMAILPLGKIVISIMLEARPGSWTYLTPAALRLRLSAPS